jgi:hypothetical protein
VFVLALRRADPQTKELPTVYRITKVRKAARAQQRAEEPLMNEW